MKLTILSLAMLLMPSELFAQDDLAEHIPADSLMYLELPDVPTSLAELEKSALGRLLNEPEARDFWENIDVDEDPFHGFLDLGLLESLPWQSIRIAITHRESASDKRLE